MLTAAGSPASGESGSAAKPPAETPLVPVQLTPQRLQSIGVKTGVVEMKSVHDEIRTMGSMWIAVGTKPHPIIVGFVKAIRQVAQRDHAAR